MFKKISTWTVQIHYNLQNHHPFPTEGRLVNLVRRRQSFVSLASYQFMKACYCTSEPKEICSTYLIILLKILRTYYFDTFFQMSNVHAQINNYLNKKMETVQRNPAIVKSLSMVPYFPQVKFLIKLLKVSLKTCTKIPPPPPQALTYICRGLIKLLKRSLYIKILTQCFVFNEVALIKTTKTHCEI